MTVRSHSSSAPRHLHLRHRRVWQAAFLVLALIPTISSLLMLFVGVERFLEPAQIDAALDSTYRYLGGVYLGVALVAWWCIPRIEERSEALVAVTGAIFLGGIGRLVSIADFGAPSAATWAFLVIELGALFLALALRRSLAPTPHARSAS
ncbi:MAG: DUF4345 domain-containing protein [Actinomycetota bacterium]